MKKIFASIIILITLCNAPIQAQLGNASTSISVSQYEKKATEAFEKKDFNKALEYYQIILTDVPSRTDLYWNTAQAARGSRHYIVADKYYELLAKSDMAKTYPQLAYYRGLTKKSVGNYDMAIDYAFLGDKSKAAQYLDSTFHYEFAYSWGFHNDPMFSSLRQRDDFKKVIKKVDDREAFMQRAFSNAINRADASNELKNVLK